MNATFAANGVIISEHLFKNKDSELEPTIDECVIMWKDHSKVLKRSDGKKIARDLLFFTRPFHDTPMLRMSPDAKSGMAVHSVAFDSEAMFRQGLPSVKSGKITLVHRVEGSELAEYNVSSQPGHCTSPVIDELGRCVGFHNAAAVGVNRFIPVTEAVLAKCIPAALFQ